MCMEFKRFLGHHGSTAECCKSILKNGFEKSKWGWLGSGVYFFEDDKDLARDWARLRHFGKRIQVLECVLEVQKEKLLDVSNPKSNEAKKVNSFREALLKQGIKNNKIINMEDEKFDNKIINLICTKDGYDLVRNFTHTNTQADREYHKKRSNICNGVELCVRNLKCITLNK